MKVWAGGQSDTAIPVVAWMEGGGASAQLGIATVSDLSDVTWGSSISADLYDLVRMFASGLTPDTEYHWAVWEDGQLEPTEAFGDFRTFPTPGTPASFRFWAATCAGTGADSSLVTGTVTNPDRISNSLMFEDIAASNADWGWHGGDMLYYNPGGSIVPSITTDVPGYISQWTDILQQTRQEALYRRIPLRYTWDDHEYGINNSDRTQVGRENAQEAWRLVVPHHELTDPEGIWQTWQHGRVLFIASDTRSFRDPNVDPQVPTKTMLGAAQKSWMQSVLSTAAGNGAEFFVWLCPDPGWWRPTVPSGSEQDSWTNYPDERLEIQQLLTDTGWIDRMLYITGDHHSMGIDSGANNPFGGFPYVQAAPIDASPSSSQNGPYDVGWRGNERGHWALVDVADDGTVIQLNISGMVNGSVVLSHTIIFDTTQPPIPPEPPEPPEPERPQEAIARVRRRVTWLSCDLASGRVIYELDEITGNVERLICEPRSSGLTLPIPRSGPGSLPISIVNRVTEPGRSMIVAVVNDIPMWAGIVMGPVEGGTEATVTIPCTTLEGYLDRRFVRDHSWVDSDVASVIAAGLIDDAGDISGIGNGIGLVTDAPPTGILMSRDYHATDHRTVLSALQELSTVEDGVEWTIDVDWENRNERNVIEKVIRVRPRLGVAADAPQTVFQTTARSMFQSRGSAEATYTFRHDYSSGRGATYVVAYSSGQGEDQPVSDPAIATALLDSGFPIYEQHYQPATDLDDVEVLNEHAQAELERRMHGAEAFHITARWDAYPRYGVDWQLGDDVAWQLVGHRHPNGITGQGRAIGFTLDMQRQVIVPILREDA